METTDFGWAIRQLKNGAKVTRNEWATGTWLEIKWDHYEPPSSLPPVPRVYKGAPRTLRGKMILWLDLWLPSQTDMLAEDWVLVP